ncbi:MAG: hypothetical protein N3A59_07040 [Thermodesulfovibrionales bacterium]|nr:hypothetical protein [Thermodesulfovibrionales bacterium]
MSAMVISNVKKFIEMSEVLKELGLDTIHFYNTENNHDFELPMSALVPFVDFIIMCKDLRDSIAVSKVIDAAISRGIPVLSDDCLSKLINFS